MPKPSSQSSDLFLPLVFTVDRRHAATAGTFVLLVREVILICILGATVVGVSSAAIPARDIEAYRIEAPRP